MYRLHCMWFLLVSRQFVDIGRYFESGDSTGCHIIWDHFTIRYTKYTQVLCDIIKEKGMKTLLWFRNLCFNCFNIWSRHLSCVIHILLFFRIIPGKNISTPLKRRAAVKQYHVSMRREQQFLCKLNLHLVQNTILCLWPFVVSLKKRFNVLNSLSSAVWLLNAFWSHNTQQD